MNELIVPEWLLEIASQPFAGEDYKRREILTKAHEQGWLYEAIARCQSLAAVAEAMSTPALTMTSTFVRQWVQDDVERANLYRNAIATSVDYLQQQAVQQVMAVDSDDTEIRKAGLQAKTLLDVAKQKQQQIGDVKDDGPSVPFIYVQNMEGPTVIQQIIEQSDAPSLDPDNMNAPIDVAPVHIPDTTKELVQPVHEVEPTGMGIGDGPPPVAPLMATVTEVKAIEPETEVVMFDDEQDDEPVRYEPGELPEPPAPHDLDPATVERMKVAPHIQPPNPNNPFGLPDRSHVSMEPEDYEPKPLQPPVPERLAPVDSVRYETDGEVFDDPDDALEALGLKRERRLKAQEWDPWE